MNELANRWDAIATDLHKWSSPLKPSKEDTETLREQIAAWAKLRNRDYARAALLGVTQEITTNEWPIPLVLNAFDISPGMVERHGIQTANVSSEVKDWFSLEGGRSYDVVMGDGSFVFYGPDKSRELFEVIDRLLSPTGVYIGRHFVLPAEPASTYEVLQATRFGAFETIEEVKFRVGMSLQPSYAHGVVLGHIEDHLRPLRAELVERYGAESVSTLDHYKGSQGRLYFPDWTRIRDLFTFAGYRVRAIFPSYSFGECCPTIVANPRP